MHNPIIAILAAAVAGWLFGAAWYTVLGRVWQTALGKDPDACKDQKKMPLAPLTSPICGSKWREGDRSPQSEWWRGKAAAARTLETVTA